MTKKEFFEALKQTDRRWVVLGGEIRARRLRRGGKRDCPITAVARLKYGKPFSIEDYSNAVRKLRLRLPLAYNIIRATDLSLGRLRDSAARHRKELFKLLNLPMNKL
jgi:hypothetical protein